MFRFMKMSMHRFLLNSSTLFKIRVEQGTMVLYFIFDAFVLIESIGNSVTSSQTYCNINIYVFTQICFFMLLKDGNDLWYFTFKFMIVLYHPWFRACLIAWIYFTVSTATATEKRGIAGFFVIFISLLVVAIWLWYFPFCTQWSNQYTWPTDANYENRKRVRSSGKVMLI